MGPWSGETGETSSFGVSIILLYLAINWSWVAEVKLFGERSHFPRATGQGVYVSSKLNYIAIQDQATISGESLEFVLVTQTYTDQHTSLEDHPN